jgi:hypothetical protein
MLTGKVEKHGWGVVIWFSPDHYVMCINCAGGIVRIEAIAGAHVYRHVIAVAHKAPEAIVDMLRFIAQNKCVRK